MDITKNQRGNHLITTQNHKKGMEESIWIIITIIVSLATALAVITFLYTTTTDTQNNIIPIIEKIGENIKNLLSGLTN